MYGELLRKKGLFDDEHYLGDPHWKRERRDYSSHTSTHIDNDMYRLSRGLHRPDVAISERVEEKMRSARWQSTIHEPEVELSTSGSQSHHSNVADLIAARSEALTEEEDAAVRAAVSPPHDESVVIEKFNTPMTRRLLKCLKSCLWLNDEVWVFFSVFFPLFCFRSSKRAASRLNMLHHRS
jgi:Ulp1 family protease